MPLPKTLYILEQVDSTNNYAMAKVHAGMARHGMAWLSMHQMAGRGSRDKKWESEMGMNIALSVVLEPGKLAARGQFYLSAVTALASLDFFSSYAGEETRIKWPNDLYWRDRKAGGILIENVIQGSLWKFAVLGIGININQVRFSSELKNPVSLKQITGADYDIIELGGQLYNLLMKKVKEAEEVDQAEIMAQYNRHLYRINEPVKLKKGEEILEAMLKGVSPEGQLIITGNTERKLDFGEVEWVL